MNIRRIFAASAAVIIAALMGTSAYATPKTDSKKKLDEEKRRLLEVIDSLNTELARYRSVIDLTDSLELEMIVDDEMWPLPKYRELLFF